MTTPPEPVTPCDCARRSEFLASMGHTLRTPLNGIMGFAELLMEQRLGPLTERQQRYVRRIGEAGARQLEQINNLVDLARIHAGMTDLDRAPCSVEQILLGVVSEYESRAQTKGVHVILEVAPTVGKVHADAERLRRVFGNLLSNAIRHSEAGGAVAVVADGGDFSGTAPVTITVTDKGPGIPPEDQALLFDDLDSAEAMQARRERRTGVGLALSRRLVELHGGRIRVESTGLPGEGSRFVVELPRQDPGVAA